MTPEEIREQNRIACARYDAEHREERKEKARQYRKKHADKSRETVARYRERNLEKERTRRRKYQRQYNADGRDRTSPEKRVEYTTRSRNKSPEACLRARLRAARRRAELDGLNFEEKLFVTLLEAPPTNCASCGNAFEYYCNQRGHKGRGLSLDRVINTAGYTVKNVGLICTRCNAIKSDATIDELRAIVAYIERHNSRQY